MRDAEHEVAAGGELVGNLFGDETPIQWFSSAISYFTSAWIAGSVGLMSVILAITERWNAIRDAAGIRWQVFGLLVAVVVSRLDWIYRKLGGAEEGATIFGFPSWILGITVGLAFLFVWMLEAAVKIRR